MTTRKYVKQCLKLLIEGDANLTTVIVRASKKQLLSFVDWLIPD
jgi:hypothetical protein